MIWRKKSSFYEDMKNQNFETKKLKSQTNPKTSGQKNLPWWVELLFVQIGLPDKLLIKILKTKKKFKDIIINDQNSTFMFLLFLVVMAYFYPVVKQSLNKLECETNAREYIIQNKNLQKISNKQLKMLSTNFCNGGEEIYEIEN